MAYTSAPENQTNSSERIPLVVDLDLRVGPQNPGMINILPFKTGNEEFGETRGYLSFNPVGTTASSDTVRGMYVWEKSSSATYYFMVIGPRIYTSTNSTSWTNVTTFTTLAQNPVGITEFIDSTNTKKLVIVDGVEGYVFTSNAAGTKITDVDFPTPHLPFPIFLDGYLFLAKADTGDIYNSDLDDPALWTAGSFISSEVYPDDIKALVKIDNYLLAIGKQGSEFFYDAANATASPLARVDGGILPFGTSFPYSMATNKNQVTLIANRNDGQMILVTINGLKYDDMGDTHGILPSLTNKISSGFTTTTEVRGYYFRQRNCLFYGLSFASGYGGLFTAASVPTYAYGFDSKKWVELQYGITGNTFPVYLTQQSVNSGSTYVAGKSANTTSFFGTWKEGLVTNTPTDSATGGGGSLAIIQEIRTPVYNFDTLNTKFMNRFGLAIQSQAGAYTNGTSITISVSDDFYNTWSSVGTISLSNAGATSGNIDYPFITQLGRFRQRAFKISATTYAFRYLFAEVDINKGQQ